MPHRSTDQDSSERSNTITEPSNTVSGHNEMPLEDNGSEISETLDSNMTVEVLDVDNIPLSNYASSLTKEHDTIDSELKEIEMQNDTKRKDATEDPSSALREVLVQDGVGYKVDSLTLHIKGIHHCELQIETIIPMVSGAPKPSPVLPAQQNGRIAEY